MRLDSPTARPTAEGPEVGACHDDARPLHRDGATTGTETEFRDGRTRDVLPDDDGVERVPHGGHCLDPSKIPGCPCRVCINRYRFGY